MGYAPRQYVPPFLSSLFAQYSQRTRLLTYGGRIGETSDSHLPSHDFWLLLLAAVGRKHESRSSSFGRVPAPPFAVHPPIGPSASDSLIAAHHHAHERALPHTPSRRHTRHRPTQADIDRRGRTDGLTDRLIHAPTHTHTMDDGSSMEIDGASYYNLGKRSFTVYQSDNQPDTPSQMEQPWVGLQPPIEPKAMQLYRSCVGFVSSLAGHTFGLATRAWMWLWQRRTTGQAHVEIVAVSTNEEDNKRRAIVRDKKDRTTAARTQPALNKGKAPAQPPIHQVAKTREQIQQKVSGQNYLPSPAPAPPVTTQSHDSEGGLRLEFNLCEVGSSSKQLYGLAGIEEVPGKFPDTNEQPKKIITPPASRPSSSQQDKAAVSYQFPKQELQQHNAVTTSQDPKQEPPWTTLIRTVIDDEDKRIQKSFGLNLRAYEAYLRDEKLRKKSKEDEYQRKNLTKPAPWTPKTPKLPKIAREAIAKKQSVDEKKRQEEQLRKDVEIESLIQRAKAVQVEPPAVKDLRMTFRRARLQRHIEEAEAAKVKEDAARSKDAAHQQRRKESDDARFAKDVKTMVEEQVADEAAKKKDEPIIPKLSQHWSDRVATAMATKDAKKVLATTVNGVELSRYDLGRLLPTGDRADGSGPQGWINDETVNGWYEAMVKTTNERKGREKRLGKVPAYEYYNTMWYKNYSEKGISSIKNWSKRKGIQGEKLLQVEKIFFPINGGSHWTLLIISPTARTIEFLDSLHGSATKGHTAAREWLAMELGDKYVAGEWNEKKVRSTPQLNGSDCGVFACINGFAVAKNRDYEDVRTEDGMMNARRYMVAVFLNGGFSGDFAF